MIGANSVTYGPVPSWRLGRSLGIDLLSTPGKTCSFNCIYCQLGKNLHPLTERREFVTITRLAEELEAAKSIEADYATFSGMGEPTLASNLGQAIQVVKSSLRLPIAVLTNSSFMSIPEVRQELAQADVVVAKLDAPNEELFQLINRPVASLHWDELVEGIRLFRAEYRGKLALQMMFMSANRDYATDMARIAQDISADEIQLNTPLRPCPVEALPPREMYALKEKFNRLRGVVTVYETPKPAAEPLNVEETLRRRIKL